MNADPPRLGSFRYVILRNVKTARNTQGARSTRAWLRGSIGSAAVLFFVIGAAGTAFAADLELKTAAAFDKYVQAVEARLEREAKSGPFLYMDSLPPGKQKDAYARVRGGEVLME